MSYKFETTVSFPNNVTHKRRAKNPSFSSILLDAIYRSIDEDHHHHHHHRDYPRTTPTSPTRSIIKQQTSERDYCVMESSSKQQPRSRTKMRSDSTLETVDLRRAIMIESWMKKQQQQKQKQSLLSSSSSSSPHLQSQQQQKKHHFHLGDVLVRQKSAPNNRTRLAISSSSENSTARDFPSSSSSSSCFTNLASSRDQSSSRIFTKTKSRALKIYGDLKRSKQQNNTPISPGRKIAAFLNSIFRNSGNSPARDSPAEIKLNPPVMSNSTCSSASSFSRSCLSKTSSSTTKSSSTPGTTKRSVRFYPVSVIVDEDSRPCGHKSLQNSENEDSKKREKEVDALMMMMKTNCNNNNHNNSNSNNNHHQRNEVSNYDEEMNNVDDDEVMEEEDDDDDGGESCASSDLFELENLSSIGVNHRYYEELPVYGTTSLKNLTA